VFLQHRIKRIFKVSIKVGNNGNGINGNKNARNITSPGNTTGPKDEEIEVDNKSGGRLLGQEKRQMGNWLQTKCLIFQPVIHNFVFSYGILLAQFISMPDNLFYNPPLPLQGGKYPLFLYSV
jgi:hypothetical protein